MEGDESLVPRYVSRGQTPDEGERVGCAHPYDFHERPALTSSLLLETGLRRAVQRIPALSQGLVTELLAKVSLFEVEPAQFTHAGLLPGANLSSLDALHLATAIDLQMDALLTYDVRMTAAAEEVGMPVLAPA